MNQLQVYISHSAKDTEWARSFAQALKERGVHVWFDEFEIQPGDSIEEAIESGLRSSDVLVTVFDPDPQATPNLFFEIGAALGMGKRIVRIVPKDVSLSAFPYIRSRQYLVRETPDQTAQEVSNTLQAV